MRMSASIVNQVVDFYYALFGKLFSEPFAKRASDRLKRDAVLRQVQEAAGAASQSLTRFLVNQRLTDDQAACVLGGLDPLADLIRLEDIANPNVAPEALADALLPKLSRPGAISAEHEAVYRVALHSVVQVFMLVGPLMHEWQKLHFASTFELLRHVVGRLNQISAQLDALGSSAEQAARWSRRVGVAAETPHRAPAAPVAPVRSAT